MKIATYFLEDVAGIGIFPLISFIMFFVFFIGVTLYAIRLDKSYVNEVAGYPIAEDKNESISERTE